MQEKLFRKKSLDKVKSPEKLNEYVKVASPALWLILIGVLLLIAGAIVWASVYNLEVRTKAVAIVKSNVATLKVGSTAEFKKIKKGMAVKIEDKDYAVESIDNTNYTFTVSTPSLEDDVYNAYVVTDIIHPISYLIN